MNENVALCEHKCETTQLNKKKTNPLIRAVSKIFILPK